jgi:3-oxoacyl-[acyl-carrier-protein] synthase-3
MSLKIEHISTYFPAFTLDNKQLSSEFNTSAEEIFKKTGINKRYVSAPGEIASDLAFKAAENLFSETGIDKNNIDFLIFCSEGFDYIAPASSCILQHRLGLPTKTGCIDLPYGCSGYVYGLMLASGLLESGAAKTILFLTADIPTKVLQANDLELRSVFSDIGTASLLRLGKTKKPTQFQYGTDGNGAMDLYVERSGFRNPITQDFITVTQLPVGKMLMNGTNVFLFAIKRVPSLIKDILEKNKTDIDSIDLFIFHQANAYMLEILRKKIKIPKEKFYVNIDAYGNSVSSSIPVALQEAEQKGILKKGMKILLAGFGIGNSWNATIIKY